MGLIAMDTLNSHQAEMPSLTMSRKTDGTSSTITTADSDNWRTVATPRCQTKRRLNPQKTTDTESFTSAEPVKRRRLAGFQPALSVSPGPRDFSGTTSVPGYHASKPARRGATQLQRTLENMRRLLQRLPPPARRDFVATQLSQDLRLKLLSHMEAQPQLQRADAVPRVLTRVGPKRESTKHDSRSRRSYRSTGAVSRLGSQFYARMTIDGVAISSHCVGTQSEAEGFKELLVQMADSLPQGPPGQRARSLAAFFPAFLALPCQPISEKKLALREKLYMERWSFHVVISARAWTGGCIASRCLTSITQALQMRDELLDARAKGWHAFRSAVADCLSGRRLSRRRNGEPQRTDDGRAAEARLRKLDLLHVAAADKQRQRRRQQQL